MEPIGVSVNLATSKDWGRVCLEPVEIFKREDQEQYLHRVMVGYPEYEDDPERMALVEKGMHPIKRVWRGIVCCGIG